MSKPLSPTPINTAEAIVEPFWDPQLSGLAGWKIRSGARHGLKVQQAWCWAAFEWVRRPVSGRALSMRLARRIACAGYDRLLLSARLPPGSSVTLAADTDRGPRRITRPADPHEKIEVALPLRGARVIRTIAIDVRAAADGPAAGWLNWVGLQNTRRLRDHLARWDRPPDIPRQHLQPESYAPRLEPAYGIFATRQTLAAARSSPAARARCREMRRNAAGFVPERLYREFMPVYMDNRYNRVRSHPRPPHVDGAELAEAGLVLRDPRLLRLAARAVLAKAMCPGWEENPLSTFPGGVFEHRCFTHTQLMEDIAATLDLAGEAFSEAGRDYLLRRLAEEGLGRTNFIVWKHDYIFRNNQLAAFSPGRIAAYAILARHWPHVAPYLNLAYRELAGSLDQILLPDGGYAEGPTYFAYGVGSGIRALGIYARARGIPLPQVMPARMKRTSRLALCLGSTDESGDFVPFGDAEPRWGSTTLARFAACVPEGGWPLLEARARARESGRRMPESDWPAFIRLPDMGVLASHRRLRGEWVKLFVSGCTRDADHNHEDKGSFVLEYAGDTFACDPGRHRFAGSPVATLVKHAQLHNMLVPFGGFAERPHPDLPHPTQPWPAGIVAEGRGDGRRLRAEVDATRGFGRYFRRWRRVLDSPSPDRLGIRDEYDLAQGDGVDFLWQTTLDARIEGGSIMIRGRRGLCAVAIPTGCAATIEILAEERAGAGAPLVVHRRIRIRHPGRKGPLQIEARLSPRR